MIMDLVGEFIGREIVIHDSKDTSQVGMRYRVIDETRKTLTVTDGSRRLMLIKRNLRFSLGENGPIIDGRIVELRPEERLKEIRKLRKMSGEGNEKQHRN